MAFEETGRDHVISDLGWRFGLPEHGHGEAGDHEQGGEAAGAIHLASFGGCRGGVSEG